MNLKTVNYRGGIVQFQIPDSWVVEIGETNGGTFYEDHPDSGTLRLDVLTYRDENGSSTELVKSLVSQKGYRSLRETLAIQTSRKTAEEDGEILAIYSWIVGAPFGTNEVNIFCFSYTILEEQENIPAFQREIQALGSSIESAYYQTSL